MHPVAIAFPSKKEIEMKVVVTIARLLLGAIFVFFGSNLIHPFLPMPSPPPGPMAQYMTALFASHYIIFIGLFQVLGGILLLINRYVPLALVVLAPIIVNILLTHFLMAPSGIPLALVVTLLWFLVFWRVRENFAGIFQARVAD
jgi:putative oxidoreductase